MAREVPAERRSETDAAEELLLEICRDDRPIRPIGDSRLGLALQQAGLATMTHLPGNKRVRIDPTRRGRVSAALLREREARR